jgi:hypothetical protein
MGKHASNFVKGITVGMRVTGTSNRSIIWKKRYLQNHSIKGSSIELRKARSHRSVRNG